MTKTFGAFALTCGLILSGCASFQPSATRAAGTPDQAGPALVSSGSVVHRAQGRQNRWTCTASGAGMPGRCTHH